MRQERDVLRSLRRYFALILGDQWEVRQWSDEGSFEPPYARVAPAGQAIYTSRRVYTDIVMPVQVHLYPPPQISSSAAMDVAWDLREVVVQAVEVGQIDVPNAAWPRRIPLFDYADTPSVHGSDTRNYYDYIKVMDLSVNTIQDSNVPNAVVVVVDLRLAWRRDTTLTPQRGIVDSLPVTIDAS